MAAFLVSIFLALVLISTSSSVHSIGPMSTSAVPLFTSLTHQQQMTLPDSTKVSLGKYVVTLGVLRAEHRNRMLQVSTAASLGLSALQSVNNTSPVHMSPVAGGYSGNIYKVLGNPVIEPASAYSQNALDMQKFCNAAKAAVCLYYPRRRRCSRPAGGRRTSIRTSRTHRCAIRKAA